MTEIFDIDTDCVFCKQSAIVAGQYYMVNQPLWFEFCQIFGIAPTCLVCADCFEFKLKRKLVPMDLIFAPVNFFFLMERYPQQYEQFQQGIKLMFDRLSKSKR